jgi:hypothetical protein
MREPEKEEKSMTPWTFPIGKFIASIAAAVFLMAASCDDEKDGVEVTVHLTNGTAQGSFADLKVKMKGMNDKKSIRLPEEMGGLTTISFYVEPGETIEFTISNEGIPQPVDVSCKVPEQIHHGAIGQVTVNGNSIFCGEGEFIIFD